MSFTTPNSHSPLCFTFTRQPFSRAVGPGGCPGTINRESLHDTKLARDIPVYRCGMELEEGTPVRLQNVAMSVYSYILCIPRV